MESKLIRQFKKCTERVIAMACLCGSMAFASSGTSQEILNREITVDLRHVTLGHALAEIGASAGVRFVYSASQIKVNDEVSITAQNRKLRDVLAELLGPRGIEFTVHQAEAYITLRPAGQHKREQGEASGLLENGSTNIDHSQAPVTGRVFDAVTHLPMAGVSVLIKGSTRGTTTDEEGYYTLEADSKEVMIFSFIGYTSLEIQIGDRSVVDVELKEESTNLQEVVVNAGYWTVPEKEQTGNISRISAIDIQTQPVPNPMQAMQGRMPGVSILQFTGLPGGNFGIQIRGLNSLRTDGNSPLYIVDGVPFSSTSLHLSSIESASGASNPLNSISPSDIESIEVLKDADATAIYGSRGANGVVLIATKKGKAGKTNVDLNAYQGVGQVSHFMDLLNTEQWLQMRHEAFKNDAAEIQPWDYDINGTWDTTRYTNWQKELLGGTANLTNVSASVSGGTEDTQFILGGTYYRESTVFPGDFAYNKGSGHMNINHTSANRKFRIDFSSNYVVDRNNVPTTDLTSVAISLAPDAPALYDANGNINWANSTWTNPMAFYMTRTYESHTANLISRTNISYEIIPGLLLKTSVGYNDMQMKEITTIPIASNDPALGITTGQSNFGQNSVKTWIVEPQLEYRKELRKSTWSGLLGSTFQDTDNSGSAIRATGFVNDALLENIQAATSLSVSNVTQSEYRYNGFFARINYNYAGKYLLNVTGRRDGSSRFGPANRFANFGAVGAAWIFSGETFISERMPFLSYGKLRSSFGTTGSDQIGNYAYLDTYSTTRFPYQGTGGLVPTRLVNPNYAWETNKKIEAGLELGFFKDRIFLSTSWYHNRSSDQLVGYTLPVITGQSSIQANLPATVQNTGWEFQLNTVNIVSSNFRWTSSLNLTIPRNKLVDFPNLAGSSYANTYEVGEPLYIRKGFHGLGVDPQSGIYIFSDGDGDGIPAEYPSDLEVLKPIAQDYYGGMQNVLTFQGFRLDVFLQFVKQTGRSYMTSFRNPPGNRNNNQPTLVMDRWQQAGNDASIQKFTQGFGPTYTAYSTAQNYGDNIIVDASFMRLKTVSLSWQFPSAMMGKNSLQSARIYFQGQNLFTFTNYLGLNPETQNSTVLPPLRILSLGFQLTF